MEYVVAVPVVKDDGELVKLRIFDKVAAKPEIACVQVARRAQQLWPKCVVKWQWAVAVPVPTITLFDQVGARRVCVVIAAAWMKEGKPVVWAQSEWLECEEPETESSAERLVEQTWPGAQFYAVRVLPPLLGRSG